MIRHEVVYGEWLAKIAEQYGTTVGSVWNAPENAAHRSKRGSPDVLYPGDVLWIPVAAPDEPPPSDVPHPARPGPSYRPYVIQQGDYLQRLAFMLRFDAEDVWEHPSNAPLRQRREPDILHPGDILWVPSEPASGSEVVARAVNHYVAQRPLTKVIVQFVEGNVPWADCAVEVRGLPPSPSPPTRTDAAGRLTLEVPVTTASVDVVLQTVEGSSEVFTLLIGHLDPVEEVTGLWTRLAALGHLSILQLENLASMEALGADGLAALRLVLRDFQRKNGLPETGVATQDTVARLRDAYGA